jgi:hypothetical protein
MSNEYTEMASQFLAESQVGEEYGVEVKDSHSDAVAGINNLLTIAEAAEVQQDYWLDQLHQGLVPAAGVTRKIAQARDAASSQAAAELRAANAAIDKAEASLLRSALPQLASDSREQLARHELDTGLGDAQGGQAVQRIMAMAQHGSPEVQAVLNTSYARTALIARSVANVDRVLSDSAHIAAMTGKSLEAQAARLGLEQLTSLRKARDTAAMALSQTLAQR